MNHKPDFGKRFSENINFAYNCFGVHKSVFLSSLGTELHIEYETIQKYMSSGFSRTYYTDSYALFMQAFLKIVVNFSKDYPIVAQNWDKYGNYLMEQFSNIHEDAVEHYFSK